MTDIPTPDPFREAAIEALVSLPPMRAGDTERDSAGLCVDTVMAVLAAYSAATVKEGDTVLYVWGMPGPDYDYGRAVNVRNGWFDIEMPPEAFGGARTIPHVRLSAPGDPITIGYCAKAAKTQGEQPRQTPDAVREAVARIVDPASWPERLPSTRGAAGRFAQYQARSLAKADAILAAIAALDSRAGDAGEGS